MLHVRDEGAWTSQGKRDLLLEQCSVPVLFGRAQKRIRSKANIDLDVTLIKLLARKVKQWVYTLSVEWQF